MKKKALLCITAAAVFVACSATAAFAAYVDADGDGLCDNRSLNQLQDGSGRPAGCGNYVDADGDGLCDNRSLNQLQDGSGRPAGCGRFQQ